MLRDILTDVSAALFPPLIFCVAATFVGMRVDGRRWRETGEMPWRRQKWLTRVVVITFVTLVCDVVSTEIASYRVVGDVVLLGACLSIRASERRLAETRIALAAAEGAHVESLTTGEATADRPTWGHLHHPDGTTTEIRYIPAGQPGVFLAVTPDGERVQLRPGEHICTGSYGGPVRAILVGEQPGPSPRRSRRARFVAALSRRPL